MPLSRDWERRLTDCSIVAVTGLAGHAYGSFSSPTQSQMWLRDFLPVDLEARGHKVRILTYGYDSTRTDATADIQSFAEDLLRLVNSVRTDRHERNRPIIFVGYDLGGLVVKQVRDSSYASG